MNALFDTVAPLTRTNGRRLHLLLRIFVLIIVSVLLTSVTGRSVPPSSRHGRLQDETSGEILRSFMKPEENIGKMKLPLTPITPVKLLVSSAGSFRTINTPQELSPLRDSGSSVSSKRKKNELSSPRDAVSSARSFRTLNTPQELLSLRASGSSVSSLLKKNELSSLRDAAPSARSFRTINKPQENAGQMLKHHSNKPQENAGQMLKHHIRLRRRASYPTKCIDQPKTFCRTMTVGSITKPFCITVNYKMCTALDK